MTRIKEIQNFVAGRIHFLENMGDDGRRKALLAELRRGVGKRPGELPQLWGLLFQKLPEELMGTGAAPSREEWAIYTALTLYAYHQQGKDVAAESMNVPDVGIGHAAAMLVEKEDDLQSVQGRFNRFALAADMPQAVIYLRGLIGLLRRKGIGLDYPMLAADLYRYQFYEGAPDVRLAWGRDFYRNVPEF